MAKETEKKIHFGSTLREFVFGMEDGMVSTMGAITGIAVGSGSHNIVVLSGFVIIAVESISMGVGSYLSNKSERDMEKGQVAMTAAAIANKKEEQVAVLTSLLQKEGWSDVMVSQMTSEAAQKPELLLKELSVRDLGVIADEEHTVIKDGFVMWGSYILGGLIPLVPYFLITVPVRAIPFSVTVTLLGLFILGAYVTKFSKRKWWKGGFEMFLLAGFAGAIGYVIGHMFSGISGL